MDVLERWAEVTTALQEQNSEALQRLAAMQTRPAGPRGEDVPKFDGTVAWGVFDAQFQSAARSFSWSYAEKGARLLRALHGPAANIIQTMPAESFLDYDLLHARLRGHYEHADRASVAEAELDRRRQRPGESLRDYGNDVLRVAREAYPTWAEAAVQTTARRAFIAGLADADLRRAIRLRQPATFSEALTFAMHIDTVDQMEPGAKRPRVCQVCPAESSALQDEAGATSAEEQARVAAVRAPQPSTSDGRRDQDLLGELRAILQGRRQPDTGDRRAASPRRRSPAGRMDNVKCYECNRYAGHYARNCPQRKDGASARRRNHRDGDRRHDGDDRRDGDNRRGRGDGGHSKSKNSGNGN